MGKANKRNFKGKGKSSNKEEFKRSKGKDKGEEYENSPDWLAPDPRLLEQIASFSFNDTIGIPVTLHTAGTGVYDWYSTQELGNVMEITCYPSVGEKMYNQTRSGLANAALEEYNLLSSDNGKTTQYTPPDIAFAIMAVGEFVSLAANFVRAYGTMFNYNSRNRTIPFELVKAMGLNPQNLAENMATARIRFNTIMVRANAIKLPTNIKYLVKCDEMYQNVFFDKGSAMGQYYVMRPAGYLQFEEASGTGSTLEWHMLNSNTTIGSYLNAMETVLDKILTSTTFNYIFTDVIRYAERKGGSLLSFGYLDEHYRLDPVFSETFMNQIHNMTWGYVSLSDMSGSYPYSIAEDVANLDLTPTITTAIANNDQNLALMGDRLLDFPYTDNPDAGTIADALEYMTICSYVNVDSSGLLIGQHAFPDHPVFEVVLHKYGYLGSSNFGLSQGLSDVMSAPVLTEACVFETFDVKPLRYSFSSTDVQTNVFGNLNYFTSIKYSQLYHIHDYAFLGLFTVRHGSYSREGAIEATK